MLTCWLPLRCTTKIESYVAELNKKLATGDASVLPTRGPCCEYAIEKADGTLYRATLELSWTGEPFKIACRLDSPSYDTIVEATILGDAKPHSIARAVSRSSAPTCARVLL